jgi:hypothetical protein
MLAQGFDLFIVAQDMNLKGEPGSKAGPQIVAQRRRSRRRRGAHQQPGVVLSQTLEQAKQRDLLCCIYAFDVIERDQPGQPRHGLERFHVDSRCVRGRARVSASRICRRAEQVTFSASGRTPKEDAALAQRSIEQGVQGTQRLGIAACGEIRKRRRRRSEIQKQLRCAQR